jgi:KDO2-lipid IV(A) lauroyltransferase
VIAKRGAVRESLRWLRGGGWVALLADQDAGARGAFVPFFGLPASTTTIPHVLAVRAGVPLYAGACVRRPGPRPGFDVHLVRVAETPRAPAGDEAERVVRLAEATSRALERWVGAHPDQYNWLHRRWKSRPAGEPRRPGIPAYARAAPPA